MIQQHVDDGRRQECVRHPIARDQFEEFADVGVMHDHHPAAERHDRKTQHTGGMRQRRQRQIGRAPLERIAHQGQRRHRLDVAAREHHAFGFSGGPAGAGDQCQIVNGIALKGLLADIGQPALERRRIGELGVEADELAQLRQIGPYPVDHRREAAVEQQQAAIERVEDELVFRRLVARIDRTPDRSGARNAEHAGEGDRVVAGQDRDFLSGRNAGIRRAPSRSDSSVAGRRGSSGPCRPWSGMGRRRRAKRLYRDSR